jgi:protein gp37
VHDIWNPWHGCTKISEGCKNCYMYHLDKLRGIDGSRFFVVKNAFDYPIQKDRFGNYKIQSGERIRVAMTSDFFLKEADPWRPKAWDIIRQRPDLVFIFVTKRPERVIETLPADLDTKNFWFFATCENQRRVSERLPVLRDLPFKHKGVMLAPFIGEVTLEPYIGEGFIEHVWASGENYSGLRPLKYDWVKKVSDECKKHDVSFSFFESGNRFVRDNRTYIFKKKTEQSRFAFECGLNYTSTKPQHFELDMPPKQISLFAEEPKPAVYKPHCAYCLQRSWCTGCRGCGRCDAS